MTLLVSDQYPIVSSLDDTGECEKADRDRYLGEVLMSSGSSSASDSHHQKNEKVSL